MTIISMIAFRIALLLRLNQMEKIFKLMISFPVNKRLAYKLYAFTGFNLMLNSTVVVRYFMKNEKTSFDYIFMFGYPIQQPLINIIVHVLYTSSISLGFILPITSFTIFYAFVSCQIRFEFIKIQKLLQRQEANYKNLLQKYEVLHSIVKKTDKYLSDIVFLFFVFVSAGIYFMMSLFLHQTNSHDKLLTVLIALDGFNIATLFLVVTLSASMLSEAAIEVYHISLVLPDYDKISLVFQEKLQQSVKREVALTVWKIVPIKRSIILGFFASIFTFVLLLDNLETQL